MKLFQKISYWAKKKRTRSEQFSHQSRNTKGMRRRAAYWRSSRTTRRELEETPSTWRRRRRMLRRSRHERRGPRTTTGSSGRHADRARVTPSSSNSVADDFNEEKHPSQENVIQRSVDTQLYWQFERQVLLQNDRLAWRSNVYNEWLRVHQFRNSVSAVPALSTNWCQHLVNRWRKGRWDKKGKNCK